MPRKYGLDYGTSNKPKSNLDQLWETGVLVEDFNLGAELTRKRLGWTNATPEATAAAKFIATAGDQARWKNQHTKSNWNRNGDRTDLGQGWDRETDLWAKRALYTNNPVPKNIHDLFHPDWQTGVNALGSSNAAISLLVNDQAGPLPFANDSMQELSTNAIFEGKFAGKDPLSNTFALQYVNPDLAQAEMKAQQAVETEDDDVMFRSVAQTTFEGEDSGPVSQDKYEERMKLAMQNEARNNANLHPRDARKPVKSTFKSYQEYVDSNYDYYSSDYATDEGEYEDDEDEDDDYDDDFESASGGEDDETLYDPDTETEHQDIQGTINDTADADEMDAEEGGESAIASHGVSEGDVSGTINSSSMGMVTPSKHLFAKGRNQAPTYGTTPKPSMDMRKFERDRKKKRKRYVYTPSFYVKKTPMMYAGGLPASRARYGDKSLSKKVRNENVRVNFTPKKVKVAGTSPGRTVTKKNDETGFFTPKQSPIGATPKGRTVGKDLTSAQKRRLERQGIAQSNNLDPRNSGRKTKSMLRKLQGTSVEMGNSY